jgi:hypothetical protein
MPCIYAHICNAPQLAVLRNFRKQKHGRLWNVRASQRQNIGVAVSRGVSRCLAVSHSTDDNVFREINHAVGCFYR